MRSLTWTEGAIADLEHIRRYLTAFDPRAAARLAARLIGVADQLRDETQPLEVGVVDAMGEIAVAFPYRLRFMLVEAELTVFSVRHSSAAVIV